MKKITVKIIILIFIIVNCCNVVTYAAKENKLKSFLFTSSNNLYEKPESDCILGYETKEKILLDNLNKIGNRVLNEYYTDDNNYEYKDVYVVKKGITQNFCVRYKWLHATKSMIDWIRLKEIDYQYISNNNDKKYIEASIKVLKIAKSELGTFTGSDNDTQRSTDTQYVVIRAKSAFDKIIKNDNIEEFESKMADAIKELQAAYDYDNENQYKELNVNINDSYETKFKYTAINIEEYLENYSNRYNVDSRREELEKTWAAKLDAKKSGYPNVATRTDLYIDKNDSYSTKMCYDKDKIWLYIQVYGAQDLTNKTDKKSTTLAVEWYNMLKFGNHSDFYNKNLIYTSGNGDKSFNSQAVANYSATEIGIAIPYLLNIENVVESGKQVMQEKVEEYDNQTSRTEFDEKTVQENSSHDADNIEYEHPKHEETVGEVSTTIDDTFEGADNFLNIGDNEKINTEGLQNFSSSIYNISLIIGIVIAVLVGGIIGIKFMIGSVEEKADVKKLLLPYVIGCIVVFGSFGIWKLVVTILGGL